MNTVSLPAGWSAQYDHNQRRYFFVNHLTQTTTWEDPRLAHAPVAPPVDAQLQQLTGMFPSLSKEHLKSILNHCHGDVALAVAKIVQEQQSQPESGNNLASRLKREYPTLSDHVITSTLYSCDNDERRVRNILDMLPKKDGASKASSNVSNVHTQHKKPDPILTSGSDYTSASDYVASTYTVDESKVKELKEQYSSCDEAFIKQILERNLGSVSQSISDIERAGYSKKSAIEPNTYIAYKLKSDFPDASLTSIHELLVSCRNVESDARKQLTNMYKKSPPVSPQKSATQVQEEKIKMINNLQSDFPSISKMVVEMVLETSSYNEDAARVILRTMGPEVKGKRKSVQSTTSQASNVTTPRKTTSKTTTPKKASAKATSPTKTTKNQISTAEKNRLNTLLSVAFPELTRTVIESALLTCEYNEQRTRELLARDSSRRSSHDSSQPTSPRQLKTPSPPKETAIDTPAASTSSSRTKTSPSHSPKKMSPAKTVSPKHKTLAKGPNPDYKKGPDTNNLLHDYVQVKGTDLSLRHGPNPKNVQGSMKAKGADKNSRCGANNSLQSGPNGGNRPSVISIRT